MDTVDENAINKTLELDSVSLKMIYITMMFFNNAFF